MSEGENAVGIKDTVLWKVEWSYRVVAVFIYPGALKTLRII